MTRSELIEKIAKENPHLYHTDAERIVSTVFDEITKALKEGNRVELRGFRSDTQSAQGSQSENRRNRHG